MSPDFTYLYPKKTERMEYDMHVSGKLSSTITVMLINNIDHSIV